VRDIVRICADKNVALFFGHATHKEIYKLTEEVEKVGLKRAVIDHPFSPFLNVSPEMMKELCPAGILFNFTWDELSPLLGVDPQIMYNTIREVGPEHFTLSSDAGEPLFPDSVEAMRLVRGYMEAFGLNQEELYTVCTRNPARVVGLELN
jgi:predicted metal-dependent TIM-barrel fold hydrolase